jgi:hypothetical protein
MRSMSVRLVGVATIVGAGLVTGAGVAGAGVDEPRACERGEFCLWRGEGYAGEVRRIALENSSPGECVSMPTGFDARSFANRGSRPVTVYQGRECETEGEFDTYPGGGTFVPEAPYVVRGVQIWEH